jgi:hypothetical protein
LKKIRFSRAGSSGQEVSPGAMKSFCGQKRRSYPDVFGPPGSGSGSFYHQAKIVIKS